MTAPRIEACYYLPTDRIHASTWARLAAVLESSARQHCADWTINVRGLPQPDRPWPRQVEGFLANTWKLEHWREVVEASADGDRLLLIDADTFILQPLDAIWDRAFDLVYTARAAYCAHPINAGVVFVRVSPGTRHFFARWAEANRQILQEGQAHWRQRFGGWNQAALGKLLEEGADGLAILAVPCLEWNCEDSTWPAFDPAVTRIVHVKSALRLAALTDTFRMPGTERLVALWREADRAASAARASA